MAKQPGSRRSAFSGPEKWKRGRNAKAQVLIVNDLEVDREKVRRCLETVDKFELVFAQDEADALRIVRKDPPDLVVTDLRMPEVDGLQLVQTLHAEFPRVPVVLLTSEGNEEVAVRALRSGAANYVPTHLMQEVLASTICDVLEMIQARRDRAEVLEYFDRSETRFTLTSKVDVISPVVAFLLEKLDRLGLEDEVLRMQIGVALTEALANAIIHGNLEIEGNLRDSNSQNYERLVKERSQDPKYARRTVSLTAISTPNAVEYRIEDEGEGFDPNILPDPTHPENLLAMGGRGVMLIRTFMDQVEFNERGNAITMRKRWGMGRIGNSD